MNRVLICVAGVISAVNEDQETLIWLLGSLALLHYVSITASKQNISVFLSQLRVEERAFL